MLVGHICSPELGSEPGFIWNWAWHLSERHDVWVVAHPLCRAAVETAMARHRDRALRFVWVELPKRWDPWDPARGEQAIHLHYMLWQRAALAQARRLHARQGFDVVHHVGWGTVNAPPALWRLGAPFVWGPLGGGQAAPLRFGRYLGKGVLERDIEKRYPDKDAEIVMYCGGGYRSALTCDVAQRLGYTNTASLGGGYRALTAAEWPMTR